MWKGGSEREGERGAVKGGLPRSARGCFKLRGAAHEMGEREAAVLRERPP